jgi:hypothetical protein
MNLIQSIRHQHTLEIALGCQDWKSWGWTNKAGVSEIIGDALNRIRDGLRAAEPMQARRRGQLPWWRFTL